MGQRVCKAVVLSRALEISSSTRAHLPHSFSRFDEFAGRKADGRFCRISHECFDLRIRSFLARELAIGIGKNIDLTILIVTVTI